TGRERKVSCASSLRCRAVGLAAPAIPDRWPAKKDQAPACAAGHYLLAQPTEERWRMVKAALSSVIRRLVSAQARSGPPDRHLLERFVTHKDEAAFATLIQRHGAMVLAVARNVLHHRQDAEDVFQATFLVLARKAGSVRKLNSAGSWLYGVAYRLALK